MSEVFQLIKRLLLFVLLASVAYVILICVWGTFLPKRYTKNIDFYITNSFLRFQDAKESKAVDVVFTGSSHAYRGFDTRIFSESGITSFNLGSSSQTPIQSQYLLRQFIDNLQPRLVVLEVYPNTFTMDGVESSLDILSNNPGINYFGLTSEHAHVKVLNTAIFSMFRKYILGFPTVDDVTIPKQDSYISGGYVERKISHYVPKSNDSQITLVFNEKQFETLESIHTFLKARGVEVVMVTAPVAPSVYSRYTNHDVFDKRMEKYGDYYNFNERIQLDDSLHFFDSHHLNQEGVIMFNKSLIEIVHKKEYLK